MNNIEKTSLSPEQLKWIEEGSWDYEKVPKEWFESKEFIVAAVTNDGRDLKYAADKFKDDREIVLIAVINNGRALQYAAEKFMDDKEIIISAVTNYGSALECASDKLKDDREVILAAVKKDGSALEYASDKLKNNREIVLEAIKNEPRSIEFASDELNGDPEMVLTALSQDSVALRCVRSEKILKELAENSSIDVTNINFKVSDLVYAVEKHFEKKLFDENGDVNDELEEICNDWFDFNQIIYQNQTMDGDALHSLAQVHFNKYRPSSKDDGRNVEEYTRGLLNEAIELNDEALCDIISGGLYPEEYLDFSDLAEKACELLWNRGEKNYANALMVLRNNEDELIPGLSNEFALKIIEETRDFDLGEEEDKEDFEDFVSEAGLDN